MNTSTNPAEFNLDSLLDGTLDDLADLPEFRPFVPGTYRVNFNFKVDDKDKAIYYAQLKVIEVLEQVDPNEKPMEIGAETGVRYDLKNEYGEAGLKKVLFVAADKFGKKSPRNLIEDMKNVECLVVTKQNVNKKNGQVYTDIVELQIV